MTLESEILDVSDCLDLKRNELMFTQALLLDHVSSLMHNAYGEVAGLSMQSQQCYRHLLTRYLIFENVLIVYRIILESTDVT